LISLDVWETIRIRCLRDKEPRKRVARELGISKNTLKKYLLTNEPPALISPPGRTALMSQFEGHVDRLLSETPKITAVRIAQVIRQTIDPTFSASHTRSHSRPHVSNDNPHIESFFKTVKYQPEFPRCFANIAEARAFCHQFFDGYNNQHRHSAIALLTPADVHHGYAAERLQQRQLVLDAAFAAHPERFVRGRPIVPSLPAASFINKPSEALDNAA
jgi:transposase InsO family protein